MLLEPGIWVILLFIIINFLIIFLVSSRTSTTIGLIISHLILVLFLGISITNHQDLKEIVVGLVGYLMVILSLISNQNKSYLSEDKRTKSISVILVFAIPSFAILVTSFYIVKMAIPTSDIVITKQSIASNDGNLSAVGSVALNSADDLPANDYKLALFKRRLHDNFLLKRSSDVIIIIAGGLVMLLLFTI